MKLTSQFKANPRRGLVAILHTLLKYKKADPAKSAEILLVPVRLEFTHPTARAVEVAGTFHDWRSPTKAMISMGNGRWLKEMVLPPGTYEYCLIVDGQSQPDPLAKETVANPFGGMNSVLKVAKSPEAAHLVDAEHFPLNNATQPKTQTI